MSGVKESFGDAETIAFVQRYFGYCLTGHVREQKFLYLFGSGGNGKNLIAEVIAEIMGRLRAKHRHQDVDDAPRQ
jgi:phage/plasmid-associated DNA primase